MNYSKNAPAELRFQEETVAARICGRRRLRRSFAIMRRPVLPLLSLLLPLILLLIHVKAGVVDDRQLKAEYDARMQDPNEGNRNQFLEWLSELIGFTTTTAAPVLVPPNDCPSCVCGQSNKVKRIVGGQETEVNQYPWMGLLLYSGSFYCGAFLINDRYAITAAHCVQGFKAEKMSLRLLEHNREVANETTTINRNVMRIVRHPKYSTQNYNNDIALLKLDEKVDIIGKLRPVCLPVGGKSFTGYDGIVTGWGATEEHGSISSVLQEVTVPIISNKECRKSAYGEDRITDNMLCAGFPEGEKDSCQGDSGGPLHIQNSTSNLYHGVGIVSWGEGCARPDHPGVYTRVNRYLTWIKSNTADACYC